MLHAKQSEQANKAHVFSHRREPQGDSENPGNDHTTDAYTNSRDPMLTASADDHDASNSKHSFDSTRSFALDDGRTTDPSESSLHGK